MYYMVIFWQVGEAESINNITYRIVIIWQVEAAEAINDITYI